MKYPLQEPSSGDGGNYIVKAVNGVGEKECTLALNFGGGAEDEENISVENLENISQLENISGECAGQDLRAASATSTQPFHPHTGGSYTRQS